MQKKKDTRNKKILSRKEYTTEDIENVFKVDDSYSNTEVERVSEAVPKAPALEVEKDATNKKTFKTMVFFASVFIVIIAFVIFFAKGKIKNDVDNPESIIREARKHVELPEEEPAIAIIDNPEALANDSFYREAEKGDYVLMYKDRAVLYSPIIRKIKFAIPLE